jgi:hypothetical protein
MNREFLNPKNYSLAFSCNVSGDKDLIIPDGLELSRTMLIKWQIRNLTKGVNFESIPKAKLSAELEIPGLGTLDSVNYEIKPSIQGKEKVQLISLDANLPYNYNFSNVSSSVSNSVLEFYTSNLMGDFNNPVNVTTDFTPIVAAIAGSSAAEVEAIQAQTAAQNRQVLSETDLDYSATVWSNTPSNHVAVAPDARRLGGSFYNKGNKPLAIDKFVDIATKTAAPQADGLLQPGGTYNFKPAEAGMGYLIYALTSGGTHAVAINLQK